MDRNDVDWRGFWPASPTPFTHDGAFDESTFRKLLRSYLSIGCHGVLINGTTGEWFSQTPEERKRVAQIAVEELGGKVTVVIGCTAYTADEASEVGRHAHSIGADGILAAPPPYARPAPDDIVNYYQMISDSVELPLMVYNTPLSVGVSTTTDIVLRLIEVPNVVAIKNEVLDAEFYPTLEAVVGRLRVFGSLMSRLGIAVLKEIGGDGFIAGGALLGAEGPEFFNSIWQGKFDRAAQIADKATLLSRNLRYPDGTPRFGTSDQALIKAAMQIVGQPCGYPRLPLLPLDDPAKLATLKRALEIAGVFERAVTATS